MKKTETKAPRMTTKNPLFTGALLPKGNAKLLDYDDAESKISFRYAQFNTRAILDCPCRSAGCEAVCYATKGNHLYPSVKESRINSYAVSKEENFSEKMVYTIRYHLTTKRYKGNVMLLRIHESGDFYSIQYLRKWVKIWRELYDVNSVHFVFYTKSFPFFLKLNEEEKAVINSMMEKGTLSMNLSIDDTTSREQMSNYLKMIQAFPLANTYRVTKHASEKDDKCDCANCAKCGACNKAQAGNKVVEIHSAGKADVEKYDANIRKA